MKVPCRASCFFFISTVLTLFLVASFIVAPLGPLAISAPALRVVPDAAFASADSRLFKLNLDVASQHGSFLTPRDSKGLPFTVVHRQDSHRPLPSFAPSVFNTRGCSCKKDWQGIVARYAPPAPIPLCRGAWSAAQAAAAAQIPGESVCTCGGVACPAAVTPAFLTAAPAQPECSLRAHTGYVCTARCTTDGRVSFPR
jgi:hypothetical protein